MGCNVPDSGSPNPAGHAQLEMIKDDNSLWIKLSNSRESGSSQYGHSGIIDNSG